MGIEGMCVLSIDDNRNNLLIIEAYANKLGLKVESYSNPEEALEVCKIRTFDIVVVDYMMPQMDGITFISRYRRLDEQTPVVMITAAADENDLQLQALQAGANDFLNKPINGAIFQGRITNLLKLKRALKMVNSKAKLLENEVSKATKILAEREDETLRTLGRLAEFKDPETNEHVLRVANYSKIIARELGLSEKVQDVIYHAAAFHDIGKVGIPDSILLKPGKLEGEEWEVMKTHAYLGYELLKDSKSIYLKSGGIIAYSHHEKYNGKGYPNGLKGELIPLYGRIVAVADVFDALCAVRPYKKPWTFEEALELVISEKGEHFDPSCVECFVNNIDEVKEIYDKYRDNGGFHV